MIHARLSASGAERWGNCPGAILLSTGIPSYDSEYSLEGTAGHLLNDRCLGDGTDPQDYIGEIITLQANLSGKLEPYEVEVTDDLAVAAQECVDYVRGISGVRLTELRVHYSHLLGLSEDEGFGTTDVLVLNGTTLHIIDFKFGRGYVGAESNKQLTLYAAGAVDALEAIGEEVTEIVLHIVQPRVSKVPETFPMTRGDLSFAVGQLAIAAQKVIEADFNFLPDNPLWQAKYLNPGPVQCQWCPAAAACPALRTRAKSATPIEEFDPVDALLALTHQQISENMKLVPLLEIFIKATETECQRRLSRGDRVPGYKMVVGREGNRKWESEEKTKAAFANDPIIYKEPALKSAPQLEKVLKKDPRKALIAGLVVRSPARPTMTTADDPREPWTEGAGVDEFAVVNDAEQFV